MEFEYGFTVRGYELDSFGHVNNAVYLNYLEEATWQILRKTGAYSYLKDNGIIPAIIEVSIRYVREAGIFDEMVVKSKARLASPYLVFEHDIYNAATELKSCKASVKYLYLTRERVPCDVPEIILAGLGLGK